VIGRKLTSGNRPTLEANLARVRDAAARNPAKRCLFDESGFTYNDAEKLAGLWNMPVMKAKALVEQKVTAGNTAVVRAQLNQAPANSNAEDLRAWGSSGLAFCDAKVLSKYWQVSVAESKVLVGRKIRSNNRPTLNAVLNRARSEADRNASKRCEFADTGFTYADATKLAKVWKTSVTEAKSRAERKTSCGNSAIVRGLLKK